MASKSAMHRMRQVVRSKFEEEFGGPLRTVKTELQRQFREPGPQATANRASMVGLFLGVCAARRGLSVEALAQSAGMSLEDANALVQGSLPEAMLSDSLLNRLAHSVGYDVDLLRLMLGRSRVGA